MNRIGELSRRGKPVSINVDGVALPAYPGETIATALLAAGHRAWRHTRHGDARGVYCGIGLCFDCLVTVNGIANVRACQTPVSDGMVVETTSVPEVRP